VDATECALVPYAALLHDVGHYAFSHALEELDGEWVPGDHESHTGRFLRAPELAAVLYGVAPDAAERIEALIRARSASPLQGLVSGSLDLDKIEYLRRDARFCGVPYGEVDVDRLLNALTLLEDPATGRVEVGIHEKGLSALESLLFAKYQMFRNVYWHHAVRAATSVYKRLVQDAVDGGLVTPDEIVGMTDERMLVTLEFRALERGGPHAERVARRWLPAIAERRLPKRALELPGEALRGLPAQEWLYGEPRLRGLDVLMLRRDGAVHRLTDEGRAGLIGLPQLADELYYTARAFRVFT